MKRNYLLSIIVIGLISLSLYSTYAMFTSSIETDEIINLSASTIPVDSEIIEYERITINAHEAKSIMLNIKNDTEANLYYGAWYEMISPNAINENIEVAKLTSSEENIQGLINTTEEKKVKIVIKNTGSSSITLNIGVAYSKTSSLNLPTNRYVITNELPGKYVINTAVTNGSTSEPNKIVDVGNSTSISVIPNTGYKYKSVSCSNAEASYNTNNNTLTLTNITDDLSCTVTNEIITYTVGAKASTGGTVPGSSSKTVNYNGSTTFTVTPNTGYQYSSVSCPSGITGSYSTSNNTLTVKNVKANGTCTVNFTKKTYTVTVSATNGTSSPTSRTVNHGSSTTFTVTPNSGYEYESLSCTGGSYNESTKVLTVSNVTSNRTCTVSFKKLGFNLTVDKFKELGVTINSGTPDFNIVATTDEGIYVAEDDLGTSYYFRGASENNYVKFAGFYWRIIRINGDGTIRMIYDGTSAHANGESSADRQVGTTAFNSNALDNAYVGYMYGTKGSSIYEDTHKNTNSSTIKKANDNWYKTNIDDKGYSKYVADAIYCNDRSVISGTGIGTTITSYMTFNRLATNKTPSLKCTQRNDKFSTSSSLGNGNLTYPVGLITADEVAYAGGKQFTSNSSYYLYSGQYYFTMNPNGFGFGSSFNWLVESDGTLDVFYVNFSYGLRPVISLKSDTTYSGNGTMDSPFEVVS